MRVSICGNVYTLQWVPKTAGPTSFGRGDCDPPGVAEPLIRIAEGMEEELTLDTVIHECLHASAFKVLSEEYVTETARDIARVLTQLGWRRG